MFSFRHKDNEFFTLFIDSAILFNKSAVLLNEAMKDHTLVEDKVKEIIDVEHAADAVTDRIIDKLNQTFITPIDREDIYALANGLDDGVDSLQGIGQRVVMYKTGQASDSVIAISRLIIDSTEELLKVFRMLTDIKAHHEQILECTRRVEKIESEGDRLYKQEVARLFENCKDPIEIIKWKEILEQLEDSLDQCEDLSDLVRGVVMKYA